LLDDRPNIQTARRSRTDAQCSGDICPPMPPPASLPAPGYQQSTSRAKSRLVLC